MKRKSLLFLLLLALLAPWTAKAQTTYTADQAGIIGTGTSGTYLVPINLYYKSFVTQMIYTADEIGLEGKSATIKTISFQFNHTTSVDSKTFTIYLGNTTKSSFSSTTDWVTTGNMSSVYTGTITTGSTSGAWVTITLTNAFSYTGGNLVVCFFDNNQDDYPGSSSSTWRYTSSSDYRTLYYYTDSGTVPTITSSTTGTRSKYLPNIKLNIGGTSANISSATFYDSGGSSNNYSIYEDYIWTFYPSTTGSKVVLDLTSFASEASWDYFRVYDGENTSATNLLNYSGSSPGTTHFVATNSAGAITVWWHSDSSNNYAGWAATLSQLSQSYTITVWPNNSSYGSVSGGGTYTGGSSCTITATPASGYVFDGWIMNGTQTINTNPYTFTVTDIADFQAVFSADPCPSGTRTIDYALTDSYGDGWNGASITVVDGCGTLIETLTISSGSSNSGSFNLCANYVEFIWNSGNYDDECGFTFTEGGTTLFTKPSSVSDGLVLYTIGTLVPAPTSLTAGTPSTNSVVLNWTAGGSETTWQVCVNGDETNLITANTHTNYTLSNLQADTQYSVKVRAYINASSQSCWSNTVTFTTEASNCPKPTNVTASNLTVNSAHISWTSSASNFNVRYATATVTGTTLDPVFEDGFESGLGNWTTYANDYVSTVTSPTYNITDWHQQDMSGQSESAHTGSYVAMSRSYDGTDRSVDNWLVTPQMTLGDVVKFWVMDDGTYHEYFEVYVSIGSGIVPSSGTGDFQLVEAPALASSSWSERTVDISAYSGQTGYVAIRHHDAEKDWLLVDDFGVYNTINTYSYGTWTYVNPSPTTTSCDLSGLSAETLYAVQVQADCGSPDGTSGWSSVYFTTPDACSAPTDLDSDNLTATTADLSWSHNQSSYNVHYREFYFYEDFEGSSLPTGWTTIDANNDGLSWGVGHATTHSGHNGAYNVSYVYDVTGTTPDDYLVSPLLDLQGTLRVWLSGYPRESSNYSEHFAIYISTNGNTASDFTTTLVGETTTTSSYVEYTASLSQYEGQQGYIAIRHFNCSDQYYLYVDDFGLYGSANWVSVSPNPTTGSTTLTGLTANTEYEWQVQGINCDGNGNTTAWSASDNFTTLNTHTVTIVPNDSNYGSVSQGSILNVPHNATITVSNNTLTINGTTVTATPTTSDAQYTYAFVDWTSNGAALPANVTGDITITANFTQTLNSYTVTIEPNNSGYGTVNNSNVVSLTNVPYGTTITVSGDQLTVNTTPSTTVTAAPVSSGAQYTYAFVDWSNAPQSVTGDVTITANFTQTTNSYTVTLQSNNSSYGTVSPVSVTDVPYGTAISVNGSQLTVGTQTPTVVTATPTTSDAQYTYAFVDWSNVPQTVTGAITITANFSQTLNNYTVTLQSNNSSYGTVSPVSVTDVPYGTAITTNGSQLTVETTTPTVVTATPTTNTAQYTYAFVDWSNVPQSVTGDVTITANFSQTTNTYTLTVAVNPANAGIVTFTSDPAGTPVPTSGTTYTLGTGTDYNTTSAPFTNSPYSFVEMVYTKTELESANAGAGRITSIAFYHRSGGAVNMGQNITVYMKATTSSDASSYISVSSSDIVCSNFTLPASTAGTWVTIPLTNSFDWDGTSNVLVAVNKSGGSNGMIRWYATSGVNALYYSDSNAIDPTDPTGLNGFTTDRPHIQFTFAPTSTTYQYPYGQSVQLTATPNSGYYFSHWTDDANATYQRTVTVTGNASYTVNFVNYKRFAYDGNWNNGGNWIPAGAPTLSENVSIEADATITASYSGTDYVATANNITINGGSITIEDGGQLQHNNTGVSLTAQKEITGYTEPFAETNKTYYLFSSPVIASPSYNGIITTPHYDLYSFDASADPLEWILSTPSDIAPYTGFIYASRTDTRIEISGTVPPSNTTPTHQLDYSTGRFVGWNLIGNPFVCNAYVTHDNNVTMDYYVLNHQTNYDEFYPASSSDPVAPLSALMVKASASGQSVTYSRTAPSPSAKTGILNIDVRTMERGTALLDRARLRFGEGEGLEKFQFNPNHTKVYIPDGDKDFAVYYAEGAGTIPVNFKAENNGRYTLDFSTEDVGFNYLHLIDNMNGNDVDLLQTPYYAFNAKSTDYASRFTIVFATGDSNDETFAFYNNGLWIINNDGEATLQVVDALGRILSSESISGSCSKAINAAPGVYMLRLINGNNVKVQKIVVRR